MNKNLKIRDLTLRDGQQSLFATRMKQAQVDRVLPLFKKANFYAMEVWGGAVPDSIMRYLSENPWTRLETIHNEIGDTSKLTALSRGRNLFGYNPYPDEVIEGFNKNAVESGIGIMRIFDALNDVNNIKSTITAVKNAGGMADCVICYTIDPKFTAAQKRKAFFSGKKLPKDIFTIDYFVDKAKQMEALGADMITIKDMAGLIPPSKCGRIVKALKNNVNIPIDFHTHCTPGYGLGAAIMAILNGVDIVDSSIYYFAGGPAAPAYQLLKIFTDKLGIDTGVDAQAVEDINAILKEIRTELKEFDAYEFPIDFDFTKQELPKEIDQLFDNAIKFAKEDNEVELLAAIHKIEAFFGFPAPNQAVKDAEIPGGMYTNMLAQLKLLQLDHLLDDVLKLVPVVRVDAGCPPLVTPTSQIVGVQSVNCVIDKNSNKPFYTNTSTQFVNLVKGSYGETPIPINPKFREKITGDAKEIAYDTSNYEKQENPTFKQYGGAKLAENYKDELLLELFPKVAKPFLTFQLDKKWNDAIAAEQKIEKEAIDKEKAKYDALSDNEKQQILMDGLYAEYL